MGLAENLAATMGRGIVTHSHGVIDSDGYFVVDPDTREITSATGSPTILMQYDHGSEILTFECPRFIEGHDMSLCNRVRVHYINSDTESTKSHADVAELDIQSVMTRNNSSVISNWTIRREATQYAGILSFALQYMCVEDDGTVTYEWHTAPCSDIRIKSGINNNSAAVEPYSNLLEEWYQKLFARSVESGSPEISTGGSLTLVGEAAPGQTIVVDAVNENNVPTAWRAVNFPSDEHVNDLIDTALNALADGTY